MGTGNKHITLLKGTKMANQNRTTPEEYVCVVVAGAEGAQVIPVPHLSAETTRPYLQVRAMPGIKSPQADSLEAFLTGISGLVVTIRRSDPGVLETAAKELTQAGYGVILVPPKPNRFANATYPLFNGSFLE